MPISSHLPRFKVIVDKDTRDVTSHGGCASKSSMPHHFVTFTSLIASPVFSSRLTATTWIAISWLRIPAMSPLRSGTLSRSRTPSPRRLTRLQRNPNPSRAPSMTICQMTSRYELDRVAAGSKQSCADKGLQFGGVVAEGTIDIRMQFVRKVYSIL